MTELITLHDMNYLSHTESGWYLLPFKRKKVA